MSLSMSPSPSSSQLEPMLKPALKRDSSRLGLSDLQGGNLSVPLSPSPSSALSHRSASFAPTPGYTNKVSFDTFEGNSPADTSMFSFTLKTTTSDYQRTRNTRVYLCAASPDQSGSEALEWAMDSLVQDGDELIVVRGFDPDELEKQTHEDLREEARTLMKNVLSKNTAHAGRNLSVIVEFMAGRVTETIERLIALYRPDSLVVGTRGPRSMMKQWGAALGAPGMGSVSRYCVSHSPVPVIVVQPERKVQKSIEKRRTDGKSRHAEFPELLRPRSAQQ